MENPFVYGETLTDASFIDREKEAGDLERDLADGQKIFLLSPRRFGKSALIAAVFRRLAKQEVRTVTIPVSTYTTYTQFLEGFANAVAHAAGSFDRIKGWIGRFLDRLQPELALDSTTGDIRFGLGKGSPAMAPHPEEVFKLPGEVTKHGGFRLAIALDEFQQIADFNGPSIEAALRDAVQRQREVGYVFAGSQPSLMQAMLSAKRPFFKAGPVHFLDRIPKEAWQRFIPEQFARRRKKLTPTALDLLLSTADLIPYDVQRLAHELWDYAELTTTTILDAKEVAKVTAGLVANLSQYYERLWEQLVIRQRAVLLALTADPERILHEEVRQRYGLGATSTVQRALEGLQKQEVISRYHQGYFFLDPLFKVWIRQQR